MALNYTQKEVELMIADILKSGDITKISQISGIGYSYVDQQLNPNDDRKSYIFGALQIICALDEISPKRGNELFSLVARLREESKSPEKTESCPNLSAAIFAKESGEAVSARLAGKNLYEQLKEAIEAEKSATDLKTAILEEIREKDEFNAQRKRFLKL